MKNQKKKEYPQELIDLVLKRTNTTRKEHLDCAIQFWVCKNLKVLTKEEIKKYRMIP